MACCVRASNENINKCWLKFPKMRQIFKQNCMRTWWSYQMETFSALVALCEGNPPVDSPHKDQWRGVMMFSLICAWRNGWANNRDADDLRRRRAHYDVTIMKFKLTNFLIAPRGQWVKHWPHYLNSLWPSDAIWRHISGSPMVQVMACCLTAPKNYPNQCWLDKTMVQ